MFVMQVKAFRFKRAASISGEILAVSLTGSQRWKSEPLNHVSSLGLEHSHTCRVNRQFIPTTQVKHLCH